ncbi:E3 ubiquitin-protein ligase AMFR [Aplysia californica]|uniref:E3 ubiquitin-protein ligase AMFR n=1 Tax=Aplysia californica TaxID=6500 RepID=A0ABM1AEJ7_APLCA|nr:E3 ubiquitin-protein ligase AMFR [Aplysia californica]
MEAKFPMATQEDLEHNADDCAICWEKMESARKLPCGHLFHNSCLRSWLEQDTSCPTCRTALSETPQGERNPMGPPGAPNVADGIVPPAPQGTTNHFFHFDGSRYVSWLPSFSVEVTHTNLLPGQQAHATQTSQLDNMAREVQVVFPSIPQQVIMEDLRVTRSVDQTIDNILEGRLIVPQVASISSTGHSRTESPGSPGESSSVTELTQVTQSMPPQPIMSADITETTTADSETTAAKTTAAREPTTADSDLLELSPQTGDTTGASAGHEEGQKFASNVSAGGRFSKSASERMSMLGQRKQAMIEQARRRYQAKLEKASNEKTSNDWTRSTAPKSSTAGGTAGIVEPSTHRATSLEQESAAEEQWRRRAVVLEATQRRLDRTSSSSS